MCECRRHPTERDCTQSDLRMTGRYGRPTPHSAKLLVSPVQSLRTADEPIAPNVQSQRTVGCARNADPFAPPDFVRRLTVRSEPQRAGLTEVDPVKPAINPQGLAQPSRAPRQV